MKKTNINAPLENQMTRPLHQREARHVRSHVHPVINILATISQGLYNLPHLAN